MSLCQIWGLIEGAKEAGGTFSVDCCAISGVSVAAKRWLWRQCELEPLVD
jgi:hypothetical protein